jgi:hypothetical protein
MRARRVEVSEQVDPLAPCDYASAFAVPRPPRDRRSAEQWARAAFEGAPAGLRAFVAAGWRYGLGLRLGPPSDPVYVLGWEIETRSPDAIALTSCSRLISAHKLVRIDGARVVMTTFVRYERAPARVLWSAVMPVHHRTEPYLLGHAAASPAV